MGFVLGFKDFSQGKKGFRWNERIYEGRLKEVYGV